MTEHRIRPREDWLDPNGPPWDHTINGKGEFYICPPFRGWDEINDVVIHYPGGDWPDMDINNDGRVDEIDTVVLLRAGHRMYLNDPGRGYSYGYGYKIGVGGDIWEIRGTDYSNAANKGDKAHGTYPPTWNLTTISIQIVVDEANPANEKQVAAVNWLLDYLAADAGKNLGLTYHRHGQATGCPGDGIVGQIEGGVIGFGKSAPVVVPPVVEPPVVVLPTPTTPTVPEDNMAKRTLFIPTDCDAQFLGWADDDGNALEVTWADKARADAHRSVGVVIRDQLSSGGFRNCVLLGPLPTGDTRKVWTEADFFRVVG